MESVGKMREYLERRQSMGLAELEAEYEMAYADDPLMVGDDETGDDAGISKEEEELVRNLRQQAWEWRMRRRLVPISSPLRDNYEFALEEMDYMLLALEIASRGLSVGKDGLIEGDGQEGTSATDASDDDDAGGSGGTARDEIEEMAKRLDMERREVLSYDGFVEASDMLSKMSEQYLH